MSRLATERSAAPRLVSAARLVLQVSEIEAHCKFPSPVNIPAQTGGDDHGAGRPFTYPRPEKWAQVNTLQLHEQDIVGAA